jgi:hypothetical protein
MSSGAFMEVIKELPPEGEIPGSSSQAINPFKL